MKGQSAECVSSTVVLSFNVMKDWIELFCEESPTKDALGLEVVERKVLVIGMNVKFTASKQHGSVLFESFNNGEKFLFSCGIIPLSGIELSGEESNGFALLDNYCSELIVRGIGVDVKRFVVIRVLEESFLG